MTEMIKQYETDIELLRKREEELKDMLRQRRCVDELNSLRRRIELLQQERYETMFTLALIRRIAAPKPPSPSLAALSKTRAGDAAC